MVYNHAHKNNRLKIGRHSSIPLLITSRNREYIIGHFFVPYFQIDVALLFTFTEGEITQDTKS